MFLDIWIRCLLVFLSIVIVVIIYSLSRIFIEDIRKNKDWYAVFMLVLVGLLLPFVVVGFVYLLTLPYPIIYLQ